MANPFASVETALNAAAVGVCGNASMTWAGGHSAAVVFDAAYADTSGMVNNRPQARALASAVASLALGTTVTINAATYTVQASEPDGLGMTTLILRRAA